MYNISYRSVTSLCSLRRENDSLCDHDHVHVHDRDCHRKPYLRPYDHVHERARDHDCHHTPFLRQHVHGYVLRQLSDRLGLLWSISVRQLTMIGRTNFISMKMGMFSMLGFGLVLLCHITHSGNVASKHN